jgi:hypothetical protein
MTDTIAIDEAKTLQEADALVDQLAVLLEKEFEALKAQDLDQFEELLSGKNHLLSELLRPLVCTENSFPGSSSRRK